MRLSGPSERANERAQRINKVLLIGCVVFFLAFVLALYGLVQMGMKWADADLKRQAAEERIEQLEKPAQTPL